ncbi:nucleotidyltransferase family protein [Aquabacter sp. CN5-332]
MRAAANGSVDWARFEQLVRRHRVTALARNGLVKAGIALPQAFEAHLARATAEEGRLALAMAGETLRLHRLFDAAGLPILMIKGVTLACLAYGDLGLKQSRDIDLLTTPEHASAARRLLEELSYRPSGEAQPSTEEEFDLIVALHMEQEFSHPASGMTVEIHWRLAHNPHLLGSLGMPAQSVPLGGGLLRTLSDETLFSYLCVHGARHCWSRLKWLADLNAFIARPETDITSLHQAARAVGAGRASGLALLLCHDVLGALVPEAILAEARVDRTTCLLAANALRCLAYDERGGQMPFAFTVRRNLSDFFLGEGAGYAFREAGLKWTSHTDRLAWPLPPALHFLYHLVRIPLWGLRNGRRLLGRQRP